MQVEIMAKNCFFFVYTVQSNQCNLTAHGHPHVPGSIHQRSRLCMKFICPYFPTLHRNHLPNQSSRQLFVTHSCSSIRHSSSHARKPTIHTSTEPSSSGTPTALLSTKAKFNSSYNKTRSTSYL